MSDVFIIPSQLKEQSSLITIYKIRVDKFRTNLEQYRYNVPGAFKDPINLRTMVRKKHRELVATRVTFKASLVILKMKSKLDKVP